MARGRSHVCPWSSPIAPLYLHGHDRASVPQPEILWVSSTASRKRCSQTRPLGSSGSPHTDRYFLYLSEGRHRFPPKSHVICMSLSVHVPVEVGVVSVGTSPSVSLSLSLSLSCLSPSFSRLDVDDPYVLPVLLPFRHLSDGFAT